MRKFIILNKIKYKTIFFYRNFFRKNPFKIFGGNFKFIKKNNKQPLVTIFTSVKNSRETLQKTINSVRMQTYKNIEYIVVDGGSVDGTLKILKRNNKYINFWISEIDKGTSEANNKAISLARGKYIFWLASDDMINRDFIKIAVNNFKKNNFDFIFGSMKMFFNKSKLSFHQKRKKEQFNLNKFKEIIFTGVGGIPYPAIVFNRSCFQKLGLFSLNYKFVNDHDLLIRLFKYKNPKYLFDYKMVVFRKKGGLVDRNYFKYFLEQIQLLKSHKLSYFKCIQFYFPILVRITLGRVLKNFR